jgi:NAD(P)-dependent dehydrogenase (short-subunit alcohol dehydrogenase family)
VRLSGKVAIVTGGASGIGRAVCIRFAQEGARIVVVDRNKKGSEETSSLVGAEGVAAIVRPTDVADSDDVDAMVEESLAHFGTVDILVNAAGVFKQAAVHEMPNDLWHEAIAVNLNGTMYCTRAVTKFWLRAKRPGKVINFGSISSFVAVETSGAYCAAKAGIWLYTRVAALELARHGINVNCVAPGVVETPMTTGMTEDPKEAAKWLAKLPIGRWSKPAEIAAVVAFLASDDASSVVGDCVVCDGGYIIQ